MSKNKSIEIDLDVTNEVFTYKTEAKLVIAIIEYLLYQRQQIPFPFPTFKFLLSKWDRTESDTTDCDDYKNYLVQQQRHNALATFESVDNIRNSLYHEFQKHTVSTARILFGSTALTPREAYVIKLPKKSNARSLESSSNNISNDSTIKQALMSLLTSSSLYKVFSTNMPPTNTFIDIEMETDSKYESTEFYQKEYIDLPKKCTQVLININHKFDEIEGDQDLNILENIERMTLNNNDVEATQSNPIKLWWEAKGVIKGFKETLIKGQSIWK